MVTRWGWATAGVLVAGLLGACAEEVSTATTTGPAATAATTTAASTLDVPEYCRLVAVDDRPDIGNVYDADFWGSTAATMTRTSRIGPPELADDWATVIAWIAATQRAVAAADLDVPDSATAYAILIAAIGEGPWPAGVDVDHKAVRKLNRVMADRPGAATEAQATIREVTEPLCGTED